MAIQPTMGTPGPDMFSGTPMRDIIYGLGGDDVLMGLDGNDNLYGGADNDKLYGGDGDDQLFGGTGDDLLDGTGTGLDSAIYYDATAAITIDLRITGAQDTHGAGVDTLVGIERVVGTDFADTLRAGATNARLIGGGGDDMIFGGGGHDVLDGRDGADIVNGSDVASTLFGGSGDDVIHGGLQGDTIYSGEGTTFGGPNAGDDIVYGGGGDDLIIGGNGRDQLFGDDGNDTIYANAVFNGGSDHPNTGDGPFPGDRVDGGAGDDAIYGSSADDTITALQGFDTIYCNGGDDLVIVKAAYADGGGVRAIGGFDYDTLHIMAGDPGGVALDLDGISRFERFDLDPGVSITLSDRNAFFSSSPFTVTGGAFVDGSAETDSSIIYFASGEGARVIGGQLGDTLTGDIGDDYFTGGAGTDTLIGGGGADRLEGDSGADTLTGGAGADQLIGGAANDILTGGGDADKFIYLRLADSRPGAVQDHVTDFSSGDRIDFSALDADSRVAGDQAFTFVGTAAFDHAGEVRYEASSGGYLVQADVDGDGNADLQFLVTRADAVTGFSAGDFVL